MSRLSDYLNAHVPDDWPKSRVVEALDGRVDRATVYRYLSGRHPQRPKETILEAFAVGLPGASLTELRAIVGSAVGEEAPWVPTKEANRLNQDQRMALDAFIRATVNAHQDDRLVDLISELLADPGRQPDQLTAQARTDLDSYIAQLRATGRDEMADRLATSLVDDTSTRKGKARRRK